MAAHDSFVLVDDTALTSCPPPAPTPNYDSEVHLQTDAEIQTSERMRVQELLRYFQPSFSIDANDRRCQVSSDTALTAFAQLALYKLGGTRSFISLIDHEYQYIIAEATASISLESADVRDSDDDALLTGTTALDLVWGMCAHTIKVFTAKDGRWDVYSQYLKADKESFVIHDMSKLDAYKNRPYVAGWPFMRYYAEVPITSPNGLAIGSICVVDGKPRDALHPKEMTILQEISRTIMDHLDLVTSRIQRQRSQQMIQGLGLFAETGSEKILRSRQKPGIIDSMRELTASKPWQAGSVTSLVSVGHRGSHSSSAGVFELRASNTNPTSFSFEQAKTPISEETIERDDSSVTIGNLSNGVEKLDGHHSSSNLAEVNLPDGATENEQTSKSGLQETLSKALHLIREAVDLDNLVFFDQRHLSNPTSGNTGSDRQYGNWTGTREPNAMAKVLSICSHKLDITCHTSETVLTAVIRALPRGGILRFGPGGEFDELAEFDSAFSENNGQVSVDTSGRPAADPVLVQNAQELNRSFYCRSMILFPLWTAAGDKLFAYAVGTTFNKTRVFQREDFAYITSFSSLVTSELSRLDILSADRAKSIFISSISHELRSPLHGILASTELLRDHVKDKTGLEIISTIESCGSTLLDTFDNLLIFAKINHFTIAAQTQRQREGSIHQRSTNQPNLNDKDFGALVSGFDLSTLVEDVMKSSIAGHHLRASLDNNKLTNVISKEVTNSNSSIDNLTVICDIQHGDWVISSQPGAWTRIVMNLLGNAMKYTTSGFVRVRLELNDQASPSSTSIEKEVVLSVEDTGRGISETFLNNHLFEPFYQEDDLQPGTGLGLSIVKQLVGSLGGSTKLTSEVGYGTLCTVVAKVSRPEAQAPLPLEANTMPLRSSSPELRGLRVGFLGFDSLSEPHSLGILSKATRRSLAIKSTLISSLQSLGLQTKTVESPTSPDVEIFLTTEDKYEEMKKLSLGSHGVPFLVLSSSIKVDYREVSVKDGPVVHLSQPFGPMRLIDALNSCFAFCKAAGTASDKIIPVLPDLLANTVAESDHRRKKLVRASSSYTGNVVIQPDHIENEPKSEAKDLLPTAPVMDILPGGPRVLLVEDNAINLKILVAFMKKLKCPYDIARDGQQAVDVYCATKGAFDMVLMDIQMPNKNGMEASAEIRAYETEMSLARTVIIAITGLHTLEAQQQAADCGIDLFLTKPLKLKMLKMIIDQHGESEK